MKILTELIKMSLTPHNEFRNKDSLINLAKFQESLLHFFF